MIDGLKLAKYLHDTGLKVQEFWFLYCVMCLEDNFRDGMIKIPQSDDNLTFNDYIKRYFTTKEPDEVNSKWSELAFNLEQQDWLDIHQPQEGVLKLKSCRVTDKFKQEFLISDSEAAFKEFLAIYPSRVYVNGNGYPTIDMPPELLAEKYNDLILRKGNKLLHQRCLALTEKFVDENDGKALFKISEYFLRYEGIALGYEGTENKPKRSTTGRKSV